MKIISETTQAVRPFVSVIIAVYKVEDYIAQCCHSLFSQTLDNIEFIFVNDCTPDNSIGIVKSVLAEYPDRVHQVKIIEHSTNLGVSITRRDGVKVATGEYIIHCDPDDWIETNMYEQMYRQAVLENADLVMCDVYFHVSSRFYYWKETPKELSSRSILASCLHAQRPVLHGYLWNKLIRTDHYQTVTWHPDISLYEDLITCAQILQFPLKVSYINQAFYYYRQRDETLSHRQFTKEDAENDYKTIDILRYYLCSSGDAELSRYWQASISWFMAFSLHATEKIYTNKEYLTKYRKYRNYILKDRGLAKSARWFLYCTTYNYVIPFSILQIYRRTKRFLNIRK